MRTLLVLTTFVLLILGVSAPVLSLSSSEAFSLKQEHCQFGGTFEQLKHIDGIDQDIRSTGVFYHHCAKGVIWSSTQPLPETLVMRRDGTGFIVTKNEQNKDEQKQLKSRQGKFLSTLLNSLMSGDQSAIEAQFSLDTSNANVVTLTPKKRSLKRAIKFIDVRRSLEKNSVSITIVDRNFQKTKINSVQTQFFDNELFLQNCQASINVASTNKSPSNLISSCALLLGTHSENSADTD